MSYKFSTGSVRQGDIYYEDDRQGEPTYIDFGLDTITLRPSGAAILYAEDDAVGIGTTDPQVTLHVKGDPGQFRVEDTTVDYAYTVDCDGNGIRTHFGDMTAPGDEDSFMTFGAYAGINRLDTSARDFHIYGSTTTTGFYFDESAGKFGIGTGAPGSTLDVDGSVSFNVASFGAAANIGDTHYTCIGNCGPGGANGSLTLTLPAATDAMTGRVYVFKRADTGGAAPGGSTLVVARNGAFIDGATDNLELGNGDCITIQCVGQSLGWIVLGNYVPI